MLSGGNFEKTNGFQDEPKENEQEPKKAKDTVFYKPFEQKGNKNKEERRLTLKNIEDRENKEEEKEALVERFAELAMLLESGDVRTEVMISGEKTSMEINNLLKNGKIEDTGKLMEEVNDGLNLNKIDIMFNLQWTEGRDEQLIIDCKMPVITLLEGEGNMKEKLNEEITKIFAGTSKHYENIRERQEKIEQQEQERPNIEPKQQEEELKETLKKSGAIIIETRSNNKTTLIAANPKTDKQVMISLSGGHLPWYIDLIKNQNIERSIVTNQPGEILPEIPTYLETN